MSKKCGNPKCIVNNKSWIHLQHENNEKDVEEPSTSNQNSTKSSNIFKNKESQKRTKIKPNKISKASKNPKIFINNSGNYKNKKCQVSQLAIDNSTSTYPLKKTCISNAEFIKLSTFGQDSRDLPDYAEQICTCKEYRSSQRGSSQRRIHSRSASEERGKKKQKKRSRCRHKKLSKRESNRSKNDCFTRFCICVRSPSLEELKICKCTLSDMISPSYHKCCCVNNGRKRTNRLISKSILKNNTQTNRDTTYPSTSERKSALEYSIPLMTSPSSSEYPENKTCLSEGQTLSDEKLTDLADLRLDSLPVTIER